MCVPVPSSERLKYRKHFQACSARTDYDPRNTLVEAIGCLELTLPLDMGYTYVRTPVRRGMPQLFRTRKAVNKGVRPRV